MAEKVLLKKYSNRQLYDTEKSSYVNLSQVARMIKEGKQVEVIDAETKEDVTAFILTQIVLEETRTNPALLPVSLLHLIIRYGETVLSEFFEKYLEQTLKNYLTYKGAMDEQFRKWLDLGTDFSTLTQKAMTDFTTFNPFLEILANPADRKKTEKPE